jgi:succinyl-CoA synthetase beta subunit
MLENQVKELLLRHGVGVPEGKTAGSGQEAVAAAENIPVPGWSRL